MEARGAGADWWDTERSGGLVRALRILPEGEGQRREMTTSQRGRSRQTIPQGPRRRTNRGQENCSPLPDTATNMAMVPAQCSLLC